MEWAGGLERGGGALLFPQASWAPRLPPTDPQPHASTRARFPPPLPSLPSTHPHCPALPWPPPHTPPIAWQALRSVNSELASVEAQRARLAERKAGLDAKLTSLGEPIEEPPKPAARGKGGRKAAASGKAAAAPAAKKARKRGGQARMMSGGPEGDPPAGPEPSLQGLKPGCSGIA